MNSHRYGHRTEVLTNKPLDKLVKNYHVGNLIESQEQSEADSNSLVSVPNRPRPDGENDCRNVQTESNSEFNDMVSGSACRTYLPPSPTQ